MRLSQTVDRTARSIRRTVRRTALTLIELIVVMMVLIALAGLLVPMFPSMLTRAHTSTCSTNMGETTKAILAYQELYSSNPNNFDALTDGTTLIDYLAGGQPVATWPAGQGNGAGNGEITAFALTGPEVTALSGVGITVVQGMVQSAAGAPTGFDPTFNYYPATANLIQIQGTTSGTTTTYPTLAGLDPANNTAAATRCSLLNLPTTGRYVCLGIGPRCSMVGKTIQTPPVHFGDQPALNPEYGYQRLVAIYQVSDSAAGVTLTQARLVGTAPIHDTGVGSINDELQNWYQLTTGGS